MTATLPRIYTGEGSSVDDYFSPPTPSGFKNSKQLNTDNWGLFDKNNQQHKTLLSQMRTAQWTVPHEKWGEVPDVNRLSTFLKSDKSPVNKPLKKMKPCEVSKIIEAFKGIVKSKYK